MKINVKAIIAAAAGIIAVSTASAQEGDLVVRGAYLVNGPLACGNCHTPRGEDGNLDMARELAGGFEINELPAFQVFVPNITPDVETGIGGWSDEEIIRAIREGVTPDGGLVGPPMPIFSYNLMSDDDAAAVVAYLRSIPAVSSEVPEPTYNIPKPVPGPAPGDPAPPPSDQIAYGGYIANALSHCMECHTPAGEDGAPNMAMLGAGGFPFQQTPLGPIVSSNITTHPETGIGAWSDEEIRLALTAGVRPDGKVLFPIMPWPFFATMTAEDIDAVIAWLRTVPPVDNAVARVDWMEAFGMTQP